MAASSTKPSSRTGAPVAHGETGFVVRHPSDPYAVAAALARLLDDPELCRAEEHFAYERLACDLAAHLAG
jgi:glycosyltransferase involved in cell wall biosynthesis